MRKPIGKIKNSELRKRVRRKLSIRSKVVGTSQRPRVCVNKTNKHLFVQIIDDDASKTLFSVQTFGKNAPATTNTVDGAKAVGAKIAQNLKDNNLEAAVFDRSGFKYTGVIAALANAIREQGIKI